MISSAGLSAADAQSVTFYRDVLPILQERCQSCHRAGEIGPMPLGSYTEVRPWAKAIRQAVVTRKMPPWNAEGPRGKFRNDPSLSQAEIDKLTAWIDGGAPEGSVKDAPPARSFAEGWSIGTPDVVFEMPEAYDVPVAGTIEYTYVIVPTGFTEDRWMSSAEVRPGNRAVIHHANVYVREPGSTWLREYPYGKLFVPEEKGERAGTGGSSSAGASVREQMIAGYIPGRPARQVPPGYGMLVPAGSDLVFQLHYTTNGKAVRDRTKVGFIFAKQLPEKRVIRIQASNSGFVIPPGAASYPVSGTTEAGHGVRTARRVSAHALPRPIDDAVGHLSDRRAAISCCACPAMTSTGNWSTNWANPGCCQRGRCCAPMRPSTTPRTTASIPTRKRKFAGEIRLGKR